MRMQNAPDSAASRADPQHIDLLLPDCNGLLRGKRISGAAWAKTLTDGVCLPMSVLASDITGNTVEETGLGYDIGDADRICRPIDGSLRPMPWADAPAAQCLLDMTDPQGDSLAFQPREILRRVVQRYAERGLTPVVAVELEFYLLDRALGSDGLPQVAINPATGRRNTSTQVYYLQDLEDYGSFLDTVNRYCTAQQIPADAAVAEYSPGQFEVNLKHRADAVAACDDAIYLKRAIKAAAKANDLLASFIAKPFIDQAGSGLHVHVSVLDRAGRNLFDCTPEAPCDALRHAIGGLQQHSADCMLLFAPHANSYRRFVENAFVPLNACWGFNNRTVAMRIPHSDRANTRIEHRIAGADANPYLVTAAVLAGMLAGLDARSDPGAATTGNAYLQHPPREQYWLDSVRGFAHNAFIGEQFGAEFQHIFGQQKLFELRNFHRAITSLEIGWYLREV